MEIKEVKFKRKTIAIIYYKCIKTDGVRFLTPDKYTLQLGLIEHKKGHVVKDHIHNPHIRYDVDTTQEFLYIEKGKVRVKLFSEDWDFLKSLVLSKGDFIIFVSGGHGLEVLSKCRIIEIKQGPFPGAKFLKFYRNETK